MTENQDGCILIVNIDDFSREFRYPIHVFTVGLSARKSHIRSDFGIEDLCEDVGVLIAELLPRVVFAIAVELLSDGRGGLDIEVRSEVQQRLSGLEGSRGVA